MKRKFIAKPFLLISIVSLMVIGCSKGETSSGSNHDGPPRDATPKVLMPVADNAVIYGNELTAIDASHTSDGYIMINYLGDNQKVKLQISTPDGNVYTYLLPAGGGYQTFPLSTGDGTYRFDVYECVSLEEDLYAQILSEAINVTIADQFLPFLYPNQYVNFNAETKAVSEAATLAGDCYNELEVVSNVYHFVSENITYDTAKASSVVYGYLPVVDNTLESKTGICFDYASLMASMLRSQGIPTKLEVGYAGEVLHAWISVYITDVGWIDDFIEFDGSNWTMMDPTFAASNSADALEEYIGDGSSYQLQYSY